MSGDRHLHCGVLALRLGYVSEDQFVDALSAWAADQTTPLPELMLRQGWIAPHRYRELLPQAESVAPGPQPDTVRIHGPAAPQGSPIPPTIGPDRPSLSAPLVPTAGTGRGRYQRLRAHAGGGLGEVFAARDTEVYREVALKEIQPRLADHPEARARFLREAQLTGQLEHPGIVPVYGLGAYDDGRPYYAMRFIRGETLHAALGRFHFADQSPRAPGERELALRSLLTRFVIVCNAVAYAHSRGVIHRDLKPDNVMLGEYGETYVVDWGLAKALATADGAPIAVPPVLPAGGDTAPTQMGEAVGTPGYMPPEQARGEWDQVGPASDVFSLGATLYALLTGRRPYETPAEAQRGHVRPARQVNGRVPAALEAICVRAMALTPAARYAGARELAADVERWLADEPVQAYREPLRARVGRWARRNRTVVSSLAVLLLASVVGLSIGLYAVGQEQRRTAGERDRAEANFKDAKAKEERAVAAEKKARENLKQADANFTLARTVVDESFGIAKGHDLFTRPAPRPEVRQLQLLLLEKALPFYLNLRAIRPEAPLVDRDVFEQHFRVAYIAHELGNPVGAVHHYQEALRSLRVVVAREPNVLRYQDDLGSTLNNLGLRQKDLGRRDEARASYQEAIRVRRALAKASPAEPSHRDDVAGSLNNLGLLERERGQRDAALSALTESAKLRRELVDKYPKVLAYQDGLAKTLTNLGNLQADLGRREASRESYAEAVRLNRLLVEARRDVPGYKVGLANALSNLGTSHFALREYKEGLQYHIEAVELRREVVQVQPDVPGSRDELARGLSNLGILRTAMGDQTHGLALHHEAVALGRKLVEQHAAVPDYRAHLAGYLHNRGNHLDEAGQAEAASQDYAEAASLLRRLVQAHPRVWAYQNDLARSLNDLGTVQAARKQHTEAVASYTEGAKVARGLIAAQQGGMNYRGVLFQLLINRAAARRQLGQLDPALFDCNTALFVLAGIKEREPKFAKLPEFYRFAHQHRAVVLMTKGDYRAALADWDQTLERTSGPLRQMVRVRRAEALARLGDHRRAAAEANAVAPDRALTAPFLYELGCILARCSAAAARDGASPLPLRERWAEEHARRAVEELGRAASAGYLRTPMGQALLKGESALDVLRSRADFRAFVAR